MPRYSIHDHRMLRSVGWRPEEPAERASDHIFFSRGITNSNLVVTPVGEIVINTGVSGEGPRHRERYESLLGRPLNVCKIILTQFTLIILAAGACLLVCMSKRLPIASSRVCARNGKHSRRTTSPVACAF